jgi:tRNA A-37 threonylcarbamoyl transferase component Bud32
MADGLIKVENKAKRELRLLISSFIALKHIYQLAKKAEGDISNISDQQAKSEIKHIWGKLRTGFFGSEERIERKIARGYQDLLGEVKEAKVDFSPEEVGRLNHIIGKSSTFNSFLERDASRGGAIEKALKKAMDATGEQRLQILKTDDEEIIKDIEVIEGFEIEMKEIIAEVEEIEATRKRVVTDLKTALGKMQDDLSKLMKSFQPVFGTGNIDERKRIISSIKSDLSSKGITLLGVGGNGVVLKVNLLGKNYALKIATKLKKEIVNLEAAQGIRGVPKFYFRTSISLGWFKKLDAILIEYIEGLVLEDYVKTRALPSDFLDNVETFVKNLHARGMAHKDLNPDNIKVVGDYPFFMDFGLSSPKASDAEKRFDDIFVEGLKLQFFKYSSKYSLNPRALAAATKQILSSLQERLRTEVDRENRETVQIVLREARKQGLLT